MAARREPAIDPADTNPDVEPPTDPTAAAPSKRAPQPDTRKRVHVYDKNTGEKLPNPVPTTWLDGRFPNLTEQPPKKEGK